MMKIITTPDPRLREKSTKIRFDDPELKTIIDEMVAASLEWEKDHPHEISAAMAAPQLGINRRLIIIRDDTGNKDKTEFTALINPEVIKAEGKIVKDYEGCLSVPKIYALVPRPEKIKIKAQLVTGEEVRIKVDGQLARTLLHEIDHLDGVLFIDHAKDDHGAFFELDEKGELVPVEWKKVRADKNLFPEDEE